MPSASLQPADGVVRLVDDLIDRAGRAAASDVHFEPTDAGLRVRFRVDSELHDVESIPMALASNVVARLKVLANLLTYRVDVPQEGALTLINSLAEPCDVRVSTFPTIRGERVVLRFLAREVNARSLSDLGLSVHMQTALARAADTGGGLILITGPAGSGKTTTLYALLHHLRHTRPAHSIVTLEDPVEYRMDGITQIQVQPQRDLSYAVALRSLLRQDPETILLGEIRDAETAHVAAEAALTGHLLLSTLHAGTPAEAVLRLMEMGLPAYQITSGVRLVASQRLLRTLCVHCRRPTHADDEPFSAGACDACLNTGYRGRSAVAEFAAMTAALRQAVLRNADASELAAAAGATVSIQDDAARHVRDGRTTRAECRRVLGDPSQPSARATPREPQEPDAYATV